jgi:hypothetical protein
MPGRCVSAPERETRGHVRPSTFDRRAQHGGDDPLRAHPAWSEGNSPTRILTGIRGPPRKRSSSTLYRGLDSIESEGPKARNLAPNLAPKVAESQVLSTKVARSRLVWRKGPENDMAQMMLSGSAGRLTGDDSYEQGSEGCRRRLGRKKDGLRVLRHTDRLLHPLVISRKLPNLPIARGQLRKRGAASTKPASFGHLSSRDGGEAGHGRGPPIARLRMTLDRFHRGHKS